MSARIRRVSRTTCTRRTLCEVYATAGVILTIPLPGAAPVSAQTLAGRVLEEGRETPVAGALLTLLDADGKERASAVADSLGRYRIGPRRAGEYVVRAARLGYEASTSPLLAMGVDGEVPFDLLLRPLPVGLAGFEVTVDRPVAEAAELFLRPLGLRPEELSERWISREELEKVPSHYNVASIILSRSIAGLSHRPKVSDAVDALCVEFRRGRVAAPGSGLSGQCALPLFNGAPVSGKGIAVMSADEIEAIAVLTPAEATTLYGIRGRAGAVLVWGRRGVRR